MCKRLLLSALLLLVGFPAHSMDYQDLLAAVVAADPTMASLGIAERQAEVSLKRAVVQRDSLRWGVQTGEGRLESSVGQGAPRFSVHPEASLEVPGGLLAQVGVPVAAGADGVVASPNLGLSLPLLQKADHHAVAVRQLELAHEDSLVAQRTRPVLLEKALVDRLIAFYRASEAVTEAQRKLLKAKGELTRSVNLDGAVPGGKAYLDGERAVRIAAREVRRADADYRQQQSELALLSGLQDAPGLAPDEVPDTDLSGRLPGAASLPVVRRARDNARFLAFQSQEATKDSAAAVKVGTGYGFATGPGAASTGTGLDLTSGLTLGSPEWTTALDVGWNPVSGPRLGFSVAWKPLAPGEVGLGRDLGGLEALAQEQAVQQALVEGGRSLKSLELRRDQLLRADQDLAEDLDWARQQVVRYRDWRAKALVTQTELDEVEAAMQSVRTEGILNKLDRLAWGLDRKLLLGEERE